MSEGLMPDHFGTPTPNSTERWPTTFPAGHQSLAPMASMSGNGNNLPITTESEGSINMGPLTQEELSDLKLQACLVLSSVVFH